MCDKPKPIRKGEESLAAQKILKRVKLKDKQRKSLEVRLLDGKEADGIVEEEEFPEEDEVDEETISVSEQDLLVEEILKLRRLSRNRSSLEFKYDNNNDGKVVSTAQSQMSRRSSSSGGGDSVRSTGSDALIQISGKPKVSMNTFLIERILFHGLNKYENEYDKNKYRYPIPEPKKRSQVVSSEDAKTEGGMVMAVGSDSDISSTSTSLISETQIVFDVESRVLKFGLDVKLKTEEVGQNKELSALSRQSLIAVSLLSKLDLENVPIETEEASITEDIVAIQTKKKKKTTKQRFVSTMTIKGYPKCLDYTVGYPECMPPGELVKMAIHPNQLWGIEINKPLTKEKFIELMHQIENYPTNDHIYLSYVYPPNSLDFNPYLFKIVTAKDIDPKQYFTLSKSGLLYFRNGFAEYTSISQILTDIQIYEHVRKVPFFMFYRISKTFRIWLSNIRQTKMKTNRKQLNDLLFMTKRPLRAMLNLLFRMIEKVEKLDLLALNSTVVYYVKDFVADQEARLQNIIQKFQLFEKMVMDLAETACRTYFIECGFSADNYLAEVEFYKRRLTIPVAQLTEEATNFLDYPGQWLPFSLQSKKKRICERITNFLHLVDSYVQNAYHRLLKHAVVVLMCELYNRTLEFPKEHGEHPKYTLKYEVLRQRHEDLEGDIITDGGKNPVFEIECSYNEFGLTFFPPTDEFLKHIHSIFTIWKNGMALYKNLVINDVFNPYTRPVVNGYMDDKQVENGPSTELLYHTDPDLFDVYDTIDMISKSSYDASKDYVNTFEFIRVFCVENDRLNIQKIQREEDVKVFAELLEKYHAQLKMAEQIDGVKDIGIFHVSNGLLRSGAIKSIMRIISVIHKIVPRVGGKCVKALTSRIKMAIVTLEKYPETPDEYVQYLIFLNDIQKQIDDIEQQLDMCVDFDDLLEKYQIVGKESDVKGLKSLVPLLNQLRIDIERQVEIQERITEELVNLFQVFKKKVLEDMEEVRLTSFDVAVLDPETNSNTMAETLGDCKNLLLAYQERANTFNNYQNQLKLETTNYKELDQLVNEVKLRHQLWDSMTNWNIQREEWDNAPFKSLDVQEMRLVVSKYMKTIEQLEQGLPPNSVVPILKSKVDSMRLQIPLISNLQNESLRRRHWDVLEQAVNLNLTNNFVTLKSLNDAVIQSYAKLIEEVTSQATAEFDLETQFNTVVESWNTVDFIVLPYREHTNVFILGRTEEIRTLLDDSILQLASISISPHVGSIVKDVKEWIQLLDLFSQTLNEWLTCQRNWMYVGGIFYTPAVQRQFPPESKKFNQVDRSWREIMLRTQRARAALRAATTPGLLEQLQINNNLLAQIMKRLQEDEDAKEAEDEEEEQDSVGGILDF